MTSSISLPLTNLDLLIHAAARNGNPKKEGIIFPKDTMDLHRKGNKWV